MDILIILMWYPYLQINIIADHIYELDFRPAFDKKTFKKLVHKQPVEFFMYRGRYFQVDGITMDTPLGPTIANFCLANLGAKLLCDNSGEPFAPSLHLRYGNNIFSVFRLGSSHESFLDKLNN